MVAGHKAQGILVTREKYMQVLLFSTEFQVFLFTTPTTPPWYACLNQRENSESTIPFIFLYMFISDCTGTKSSFYNAQTSVLNVINTLYQNTEPSVMKFSNSHLIWYLPLLVCNWLFIRGVYLWQSWGSHTTKLALVCKELSTLSIPFVRKRRTANKLYCTIYLSSVFLIKRNAGVVAFKIIDSYCKWK